MTTETPHRARWLIELSVVAYFLSIIATVLELQSIDPAVLTLLRGGPWLANPCFWIGILITIRMKQPGAGFVFFATSVGLAVTLYFALVRFLPDMPVPIGFWLWFGSFCIAIIGSVLGIREDVKTVQR